MAFAVVFLGTLSGIAAALLATLGLGLGLIAGIAAWSVTGLAVTIIALITAALQDGRDHRSLVAA